jgi:hypothetical protein
LFKNVTETVIFYLLKFLKLYSFFLNQLYCFETLEMSSFKNWCLLVWSRIISLYKTSYNACIFAKGDNSPFFLQIFNSIPCIWSILWVIKKNVFNMGNIIQLMSFHKVDTVIYQPRGSDVHRSQRLRWTSLSRGW